MAESPFFSINDYDSDGDETEVGIFLHFGITRIRVALSASDLLEFIDNIKQIHEEITTNYTT